MNQPKEIETSAAAPSGTEFIVACVQTAPKLLDRDANLDAQQVFYEAALAKGARLVVFPECSTTGWRLTDRAEAKSVAEPATEAGTAVARWASWTRRDQTYIVAGLIESDGSEVYNTAVLVGPDGVIGRYRKLHTWAIERTFYAPGDLEVPVFETEIGNIAMAICYDVWFPEVARVAALENADVLCVPSNWVPVPTQTDDVPKMANMLCMTQAHTNLLYVAAASRVGEDNGQPYIGSSIIVDHSGFPLAGPADGVSETLLLATIDPIGSRAERTGNPFNQPLGDRRTDVYGQPPTTPMSCLARSES